MAGVDSDHDALHAEAVGEARNEVRVGERRRIDGDLVCAVGKEPSGVLDRLDAARDAERDVDRLCDAADPALVDDTAVGRCGDVVEDELVGAFFGIALRERNDFTHDLVAAEPDALDDHAVLHVKAGDYAFGQHWIASSTVKRPSRSARPTMTPQAPVLLTARMSSSPPIPPEARKPMAGKAFERSA